MSVSAGAPVRAAIVAPSTAASAIAERTVQRSPALPLIAVSVPGSGAWVVEKERSSVQPDSVTVSASSNAIVSADGAVAVSVTATATGMPPAPGSAQAPAPVSSTASRRCAAAAPVSVQAPATRSWLSSGATPPSAGRLLAPTSSIVWSGGAPSRLARSAS